MLKYIIKRLLQSLLILFGVSVILYIIIRCMPVDFVANKIAQISAGGATVSEEFEKTLRENYGLTDNTFLGILEGYFNWLGKLCRMDLGMSFSVQGHSVVNIIKENMGVSFAVAFIATIFEFMIAIPLGITAATHQYSLRDYFVTVMAMIGVALPSFFFAQMLRGVLAVEPLNWFPYSGLANAQTQGTLNFFEQMLDYAHHLALPIIVMVILSIGGRMRMTRTNMLEVLNSDYIRTARAKGCKEGVVIYKHAFRNTLIPLVTSLAGLLPSLFSGSIIIEQLFDLPGIGNIAYDAMVSADIPLIMGYNMFLALLSVIGVLLSDLMYAVVDPRVKLA